MAIQYLEVSKPDSEKAEDDATQIGEYGSNLCMLEYFVGHAEQSNIRVRRCGGMNVPFGDTAEYLGVG